MVRLSLSTVALASAGVLCPLGCASGSDTGAPGQSFTLNLALLVPLNQDPFADVDELLLVVEPAEGTAVEYLLPQTSGSPEIVVDPVEDATLVVDGYSGGQRVAFGRTDRFSLSEGTLDARVLVSDIDSFAWLENLSLGLNQAAVVSTGGGGFLAFGGSQRAPSLGNTEAEDSILRVEIAAPGEELRFESVGTMPTYTVDDVELSGRTGHTATLLAGEGKWPGDVLVAGGAEGFLNTPTTTDSAFLYDPISGSVESELTMDSPRWGHVAAVNNGDVYLFGGVNKSAVGSLTRVMPIEYFDHETGTFESLGQNLPGDGSFIPLFGAAAAMGNDGALYCGGLELDDVSGDGAADWRAAEGCAVVSVSGVLSEAAPLPAPVMHFVLTTLADGRVLLTGGVLTEDWVLSQSSLVAPSAGIYLYDPASDSWSDTQKQLRIPRARHMAATLPDGRVLIAGGSAEGSDMAGQTSSEGLACAELYDPENNTLILVDDCDETMATASLPARMNAPAYAVDPDYGVLLFGGLSDGTALDVAALWVADPG